MKRQTKRPCLFGKLLRNYHENFFSKNSHKEFFFGKNIKKNVRRLSISKFHFVRTVRIRSFSGPYLPAFGLNTE